MALTLATTAAACGAAVTTTGRPQTASTTITVATFNEFGYEGLIDEWNAANDDIKIEQVKVGTWDDAQGQPLHEARRRLGPLGHRGDRG